MDVNFEYYRIFYYVAKYRNFTKAAHALHNSQPNITRAMNCLEREIHCTLFIRTNRGVRLTEEGEKLFRHVSAAMMQILAAEEELTESAELEKGCVSISASEIALNIFLLEKLKKFHMAYPKVQLKLYNHSTPQAIHAVQSGEADFAVITTPTVTDKTLKTTRLCEFQEILIAGNTFQALAEQKLSLQDLLQFPLICMEKNTLTRQFYQKLFLEHGLSLEPSIETATADQILPLVKHELGLAFLPKAMAKEAIAHREILCIPLKDKIPKRSVSMIYDARGPRSVAAQTFQKILLEEGE